MKHPAPERRRRLAGDALGSLTGSALYALAVDLFTAPNHLIPGGATGLATLLHDLCSAIPIGGGILLINLPLLAAAWRRIGRAFTLRTAAVTLLSSLLIDLGAPLVPPYTDDPLLAALFGGVLSGAGLGLIFLRGATTGGSETAARLLERRFPHLSVGRLILLVDGAVIALAAVIYRDLSAALYAGVLTFVTTAVMDEVIGGARRGRTVLVVSRENPALAQAVMHTLRRGVTLWEAAGGYTGETRQVLLCAVRPQQVPPLRALTAQIDPAAFVIVLPCDEVLGQGFRGLRPKD